MDPVTASPDTSTGRGASIEMSSSDLFRGSKAPKFPEQADEWILGTSPRMTFPNGTRLEALERSQPAPRAASSSNIDYVMKKVEAAKSWRSRASKMAEPRKKNCRAAFVRIKNKRATAGPDGGPSPRMGGVTGPAAPLTPASKSQVAFAREWLSPCKTRGRRRLRRRCPWHVSATSGRNIAGNSL